MIITSEIQELDLTAQKIIKACKGYSIWLFVGDMGAGKTTLIKAICQNLGSSDTISSPTFSLVNEYRSKSNQPIYHFDVYRLNDQEEALDFGIQEYFESGHLCLIEWPSKIEDYIPEEFAMLKITNTGDQTRKIEIELNS